MDSVPLHLAALTAAHCDASPTTNRGTSRIVSIVSSHTLPLPLLIVRILSSMADRFLPSSLLLLLCDWIGLLTCALSSEASLVGILEKETTRRNKKDASAG